VTEYDIFLPTLKGDGNPVERDTVDRIKSTLTNAYGGYTHLQYQSEGEWKIGGTAFREAVIIRVLDDGSGDFDMKRFKTSLETLVGQETVLIVARAVTTL
jgi:hypothetical protein